jgi:glycosyltransferase involved in cell wall biosynthesis
MNKIKNIVFNTYYKDAAASMFYIEGMKGLNNITFFDYGNYSKYDIALFMTYKKDLEELKRTKKENKLLIIGLLDPRGLQVEEYLEYVDFLVVDSIEMKDFFSKYNLPIFTYYEYANIPLVNKIHKQKDKIILGYHGNKIHLTAMFPEITSAIELLAQKYDIELLAMYNIEQLGIWDIGVPKNIEVKHIQWNMENYTKILSEVDIGLAPACMPIKQGTRKKSIISRFFNDTEDDYLIKFKMPSNPGRLIVFAKLGIPVVADFLPSNLQFVKDEENGFIAYSTGGWYKALEKLIKSSELRQEVSDNMLKVFDKYFDYSSQNIKFTLFLNKLEDLNDRFSIIDKKIDTVENIKFKNSFIYTMAQKLIKRVKI